MYCKNCGAKLDQGASYCVSCLTRVTASEPAPVSSENSTENNKTENSSKNNMTIVIAAIAAVLLLLYLL